MSGVRTAPPSGKGHFLREPSLYRGSGGMAPWSRSVGLRWVAALNQATSDAELRELIDAGFRVYLWSGPSHWTPATWRIELAALAARVRRLGLAGIIANPELGNTLAPNGWRGETRREAELFAEAIRLLRAGGVDVGIVSVPTWVRRGELARSGAWALVECYGRTVGWSADVPFGEWLGKWDAFYGPRRVAPALAASWARDAATERRYLDNAPKRGSCAFWTANPVAPRAGDVKHAAMKDYDPGGVASREGLGSVGAILGIAAAAVAVIILAVVLL